MLQRLIRTDDDLARFVVRLGLAIVIFPHGAQKALGWFGGGGIAGTIASFGSMGVPTFVTVLVIIAEFLGSLALAVGALGRLAAFGIACVMAGAVVTTHLPYGFFMNWTGQQAGEGFEYHILALSMALAIMIGGSGRWSVDRALSEREAARR